MKKLLISLLLLIGLSANAVELGLVTTYNKTTDTSGQGVTIGEKFDKVGVSYGYFQSVSSTGLWQHKSAYTANYTLYDLNKVSFNVKAGYAHIDKQNSTANGWTTLTGLGASYKLSDSTKLAVEYVRQHSSSNTMSVYNANILQAGLKVSF
jgi:hypothetical protein